MKCPYCYKEVVPEGNNCPRCKAEIVKKEIKPEPVSSVETIKEVK